MGKAHFRFRPFWQVYKLSEFRYFCRRFVRFVCKKAEAARKIVNEFIIIRKAGTLLRDYRTFVLYRAIQVSREDIHYNWLRHD